MTQFYSHNPFTETTIAAFETLPDAALYDRLEQSYRAQKQWKQLPLSQREACFIKLEELILTHKEPLARCAVEEMGKTYVEALAEVNKCTTACRYYVANAKSLLQSTHTVADTGKQVTQLYEPMGVVLGIFPWNFPFWQIIRSAVPVLIAGNAMLVKPAPQVPRCSLLLQVLFEQAGFPEHVVQTLFITEKQIESLIADERIAALTLTGSERAGAAVASRAGLFIKKTVLELGGSDPFIVCADAPLDEAAETAITARFQNNGQSCIASKRFILHKDIADVFLEKLIPRIAALRLGNPMAESTHIGPVARKDLKETLTRQVNESIQKGARVLFRHSQVPESGNFFPPTVLTDIPEDSPAYREELFGPVVSIFIAENDEDAIRIANDSPFGLGGCIWAGSVDKGMTLAKQLETGQVFINGLVKSHAAFPFGGVKHSGIGRELGAWGIREFCEVKTIWV